MQIRKNILVCQEYGDSTSFSDILGEDSVYTLEQIKTAFERRTKVLSQQLKVRDAATLSGNYFRFQKIAGIIDLNSQYEIEICPKFLNPNDSSWKNDFFQIAAITTYGKIFSESAFSGGVDPENIFGNLLARVFIAEYNKNKKRPLRKYNRRGIRDFEIIGEVDWTTIFLPEEDGFDQSILLFSKRNKFNATVNSAAQILRTMTIEPRLKDSLIQISKELAPQDLISSSVPLNVPSRNAEWVELYKLSLNLIRGIGVTYEGITNKRIPGFLIQTEKAWEELLLKACILNYPGKARKAPFSWGTRIRRDTSQYNLTVNPDIVLFDDNQGVRIIIDAKYKGRENRDSKITRSDLYEMYAFLKATSTSMGILLYPISSDKSVSTGDVSEFERCEFENVTIVGANVVLSGISKKEGFRQFSSGIKKYVDTFL
jgi:5-methylcytosine-specific restriction enzyme subunit McrC